MKSTKEMKDWEVMKAFDEGKEIEIDYIEDFKSNSGWVTVSKTHAGFNFQTFKYRIKPQEPQTDWSKVAKGTAVFVRDNDDEEWQEAFFLRYDSTGDMYPFNALNGMGDWWDECKLDKSAPSIINWLPYTKKEEIGCSHFLVKYIDGSIDYVFTNDVYNNAVEYAII